VFPLSTLAGWWKMAGGCARNAVLLVCGFGRGLVNFPKAFLLRFLASKNEEKD